MRKNNQAKRTFSRIAGKTDDQIIHDIQFTLIRKYNLLTFVEQILLFEKESGKFRGFSGSFTKEQIEGYNVRNPDLFIPSLKLVIEIDGAIHDKNVTRTEERDQMYLDAGLNLLALNLTEIKMLKQNIYELIEAKLKTLITTNTKPS